MVGTRVQKILSQAGLGSRREVERWIEQGLVKINGEVAILGATVSPTDKISVNGKYVAYSASEIKKTRILLYHKPVGEVCSRRDPKFDKTVFDGLPHLQQGRWVQVGRLDLNTSGLLVFTNEGELANQLMHPRFGLEREYAVRVKGEVTPAMLRNLKKGVLLEDGMAKFQQIHLKGGEASNVWYHVVLTEGRHREIRRLWASQGLTVSRLIRIRYGNLTLPRNLARGQLYELKVHEVKAFVEALANRGLVL